MTSIDLEDFPNETMFQILYNLPYRNIIQSCRTSRQFNDICNTEYFWQLYAGRNNIPLLPGFTWKESVHDWETQIQLLYYVEFTPNMALSQVVKDILKSFKIDLGHEMTQYRLNFDEYDDDKVLIDHEIFTVRLSGFYYSFYNPLRDYTLRDIAKCCYEAWYAPFTDRQMMIAREEFSDVIDYIFDDDTVLSLSQLEEPTELAGLEYVKDPGYFNGGITE